MELPRFTIDQDGCTYIGGLKIPILIGSVTIHDPLSPDFTEVDMTVVTSGVTINQNLPRPAHMESTPIHDQLAQELRVDVLKF